MTLAISTLILMTIRKLHIRIPLKVKPEAPQVDNPTLRVFCSRPSMALSGEMVPRLRRRQGALTKIVHSAIPVEVSRATHRWVSGFRQSLEWVLLGVPLKPGVAAPNPGSARP